MVSFLLEFCRFEVSLRRVEGLFSGRGVGTSVVFGGGGAWRRLAASAAWSWRPVCGRLGGLEAASNIEGCGWAFLVLEAAAVLVCVSEKTQSGSPYAAGRTASLTL
jgi:hypothetical protein